MYYKRNNSLNRRRTTVAVTENLSVNKYRDKYR